MPSSVSSSDDEGLTCLLDIVGGDSDHRADPTITTFKEERNLAVKKFGSAYSNARSSRNRRN